MSTVCLHASLWVLKAIPQKSDWAIINIILSDQWAVGQSASLTDPNTEADPLKYQYQPLNRQFYVRLFNHN